MQGAFYTGKYRNVFAELGYSQDEIDQKLSQTFHEIFMVKTGFIPRLVRIWGILKTQGIMMCGQRECHMP